MLQSDAFSRIREPYVQQLVSLIGKDKVGHWRNFEVSQQISSGRRAADDQRTWGNISASLKSLFERLIDVQPAEAVIDRLIQVKANFTSSEQGLVELLSNPLYSSGFEKSLKRALQGLEGKDWPVQFGLCLLHVEDTLNKGELSQGDARYLYRSLANLLADHLLEQRSTQKIFEKMPLSGLLWLFSEGSYFIVHKKVEAFPSACDMLRTAIESWQKKNSKDPDTVLPFEDLLRFVKELGLKRGLSFQGVQLLAALLGGIPLTKNAFTLLKASLSEAKGASSHLEDYQDMIESIYAKIADFD